MRRSSVANLNNLIENTYKGLIRTQDLSGLKFGKLTVLERVDDYIAPSGGRHARWKCRCDCGALKEINGEALLRGQTVSCGCFARNTLSKRQVTHGQSRTRLYRIWCAMKARCNNPNTMYYSEYGGRGIAVCDEWSSSFEAFRDWALENQYNPSLSIDRIDTNGNYEPSNCRWVGCVAQANNRRSNVVFTMNGETHTLKQWSDILGVNYNTVRSRVWSGWTIERALTT